MQNDDLERFAPFAENTPKGPRGTMRQRDTGKWVRLDDVALLRLENASLRQQLHNVESAWTDLVCEAFARSHDREEAAQIGEPDPWTHDGGVDDIDWVKERVSCVREGLKGVAEYIKSLDSA